MISIYVARQLPITQLLNRHRVRWLGHAARKPETILVKQLQLQQQQQQQLQQLQLLFADPRPVGRPHYTLDGATQDLSMGLQLDLLRDWPQLGAGCRVCGRGVPVDASLPVLVVTGLR